MSALKTETKTKIEVFKFNIINVDQHNIKASRQPQDKTSWISLWWCTHWCSHIG